MMIGPDIGNVVISFCTRHYVELLKQTGVTLSPAYAVLLLNSMSAFDLVWVIETPEKSSLKAEHKTDLKLVRFRQNELINQIQCSLTIQLQYWNKDEQNLEKRPTSDFG